MTAEGGRSDPISKRYDVILFDTETTGLIEPNMEASLYDASTVAPDIVSMCWKQVGGISNYFVMKTDTPSHPKALHVHKITPEVMAAVGKDPETVMRAFLGDVKNATFIVAHNVRFDRKVVRAFLLKRGWLEELEMFESKVFLCTMLGAMNIWDFPRNKWPKLKELADKAGVAMDTSLAHNAEYDVKILEGCFVVLASKYADKL